MKHITKIKEIIEEIVIGETNDKTEYLVNFRTNEKIYTDYQWEGENKIARSREGDLKTYLNTVDGFNQGRKEAYFNQLISDDNNIIINKNNETYAITYECIKCKANGEDRASFKRHRSDVYCLDCYKRSEIKENNK